MVTSVCAIYTVKSGPESGKIVPSTAGEFTAGEETKIKNAFSSSSIIGGSRHFCTPLGWECITLAESKGPDYAFNGNTTKN